jgi:hypothetical protein
MSNHKPATREEFKNFCLRRLGAPLLEINVANEQIEDCVEISLEYYQDYHFDGSRKTYVAHEVTQTDIDNKYVTIPTNIIGVTNVLPMGSGRASDGLFNWKYQLSLNDFGYRAIGQGSYYYMMMQNISMMEEMFSGQPGMRFNRHTNKVYIDADWSQRTAVGQFIVLECYELMDPDTYTDVWNDRWLKRYATAQIKKQWGDNLKKFDGMAMPGGVTFNGQKIWDEATDEIATLEAEMLNSYSLPITDLVG